MQAGIVYNHSTPLGLEKPGKHFHAAANFFRCGCVEILPPQSGGMIIDSLMSPNPSTPEGWHVGHFHQSIKAIR